MTFRSALALLCFVVPVVLHAPSAQAVPSYARQMNMDCSGCHTHFPQLNAFGRQFKLGGYTLTAQPQIEGTDRKGGNDLSLPSTTALGLMFQGSYTSISKSLPDTQNNSLQFPQEVSLFFAGRLTPRIGTFVQMTYDGAEDKFGIDNTEFRYADATTLGGRSLVYGLTLNNNPSIEDLWNSTPVWGFPYTSSGIAPGPGASALVQENLGQTVAGLGAYGMWDNTWYGAVTLYRSAQLGSAAPNAGSENTIDNIAPYWRLAWQHQVGQGYLEIGTYGLFARLYPEGITGLTDRYTDFAGDFQYERPIGENLLTLHGSYIHEQRKLDASVDLGIAERVSNHLDTWHLDGSWLMGRWQFTGGYFASSGGQDATLFAPGDVDGSASGKPDSTGYIAQASYAPWRNVQLQTQFIGYTKFNGGSSNYDGQGRSASDNNTLYALAWFVW